MRGQETKKELLRPSASMPSTRAFGSSIRRATACGNTSRPLAGVPPNVTRLSIGADDLEVLADEDVVRPVDADVVDLVLAVTQLETRSTIPPG